MLAACTKTRRRDGPAGIPGRVPGVLRVAIREEPKNLNPLLVGTTVEGFIDRLMFEPLLSADPHGNPVPMLAAKVPTQDNGGVSRDGLTIVYHLRGDARWSDGVPVRRATCAGRGGDREPEQRRRLAPRVRRRPHDRDARSAYRRRPSERTVLAVRQHVLRRERPAVRSRAGARPRRAIPISTKFRSTRAVGERRPVPLRRVAARRPHRARRQPRVLPRAARL